MNPETIDSLCGLVPESRRTAVTSEKMREIEDRGVSLGISRILMMENAGSNLARFVISKLEEKRAESETPGHVRVLLVAGTGNNGGDLFVAARHLLFWLEESEVHLFLVGSEKKIVAEEASANWNILKRIGAGTSILEADEDIELLEEKLLESEVIMVGLFGTGFKGKPRELQEKVIELINSKAGKKATRISVDLPSGMEADTGQYEIAVKSDFTITMGAPKKGLVSSENAKRVSGVVLVANIGVPS